MVSTGDVVAYIGDESDSFEEKEQTISEKEPGSGELVDSDKERGCPYIADGEKK